MVIEISGYDLNTLIYIILVNYIFSTNLTINDLNMKKINWQIFISFSLLFSFILMLVSGIILYFKPEGSVARWLDWQILFLSKASWESIHTIFSFLFMIIAFFHILKVHLLNFFIYLNKKHHYALKEFFLALAICLIILFGTTLKIQPFQSVYNLGNNLSDAWERPYDKPNDLVSASSTINEIAANYRIPDTVLLNTLRQAGISDANIDLTLSEIASKNNSSPQQVYSKISYIEEQKNETKSDITYALTIREVAFILKIEPDEIIQFIEEEHNIGKSINLAPSTNLWQICNKTNIACSELRDELYRQFRK